MPKVQIAGLTFTGKSSSPREWQAFAHVYRDRRAAAAVVDNTFSIDRPVDVTIAAIGGSHARVAATRAGELDTVVWAAGELGDWYGRPHRAGSVAAEMGHRWTKAPMRPWLRAGYLYASGDGDADDDRHGTFFQMLPSSRKYALSSVYAQMNLSDLFVQVLAEPGRVKTRLDLHKVSAGEWRRPLVSRERRHVEHRPFLRVRRARRRRRHGVRHGARRHGGGADQEVLVAERVRRYHPWRRGREADVRRHGTHDRLRRERDSFLIRIAASEAAQWM